jgi:hypothetical protein
MARYFIQDWAGNYAFDPNGYQGSGHLHPPSILFDTWEDAEFFLSEKLEELGKDYDTDRGEYYIERYEE